MAWTHSNSFVGEKFPQHACVLATLCGGIAFAVTQIGHPIVPWLFYALLAALFSSVWPDKAQHWSVWLCLPIFLLLFLDLVTTWNINVIFRNVSILARALPSACLGAYVGSKLSIRRIAGHSPNRRAKRKRKKSNVNGAQGSLVFKGHAGMPRASVATGSSSLRANAAPRALLTGASFQDLNDALVEAAQAGDLNRIKLLVAGGADVNARSSDQWPPSMVAGQDCDARMFKSLFGEATAVSPEASGDRGLTALMIATIEGRAEVVRALLKHGAQASAEDENGWTALRFAVAMDETEILRALLYAGANANVKDLEGKTALMQAASENIRECLKILLEAGADPFVKDRNGQTALMIAQKHGHTRIIKLLKEAEAKSSSALDASFTIPENGCAKPTAQTHRVIKIPRDKYYGLVDRYDVVPIGDALPSGCEETGREGNEEECLDYAWKHSIEEPSELGWLLSFGSQLNT